MTPVYLYSQAAASFEPTAPRRPYQNRYFRAGVIAIVDPLAIACAFVAARQGARALPEFPGVLPTQLAQAYVCQDRAIARWPDRIGGWKVGYIAAERRDEGGDERVIGPIFERSIWQADGSTAQELPVISGGFAAVEAEFVFRIRRDLAPDKLKYSEDEATQEAAALHFGIEFAASPLATINLLGPTAVASDFGNNAGLVLGPALTDWRQRSERSLLCTTEIEGIRVGAGSAASIPGGLAASLAFALQRCARRGYPLRAGQLISTGAATGIHDIRIGEHACIRFDGLAELHCRAVQAQAPSSSPASVAR